MRTRAFFAALPFLAAAVSGCTVTAEPTPAAVVVGTSPAGTLIVDWTIELRSDPTDCALVAASTLQVHVFTVSGADAGTFAQTCTAFSTSIVLDPGSYSATAQLLNDAGQARSTAVAIQPFTLVGNDVLHTPVDFPADSFF
jgi:hypothetical protein